MELETENLIFSLEDKKTKKTIYKYEVELLEFQKETLKKEISFYYTFKDIVNELEENMSLKIKAEGSEKNVFSIKHLDKILHEVELDSPGIAENEVLKNEVQLYFIFEKASKIIINKIVEEHKNIILSNTES